MITVRASSLADLLDCPARWEARNILEIRQPTSGAAHLGTAIHAGTAAYDRARLAGDPVTPDEAAGVLVDTLHHPEGDVEWDEGKGPDKVEPIALRLHSRYCAEISPAHEYRGVEVTCERLELPDIGLTLTGTTDRVRALPDGRVGIADIKTGARAVGADGRAATQGHAVQLGVYELLAEHAMGLPVEAPAEIIGLQTATAARVGTAEVERPRDALIGDGERPGLLELAAEVLERGLFWGNPRSMLCHPRYCPVFSSCRFRR